MTPRFKLLHVITGLNDGGAEGTLYRLCVHNPDYDHVVVSMIDRGKYGQLLVEAGVEVHCLGMRQGRPSVGGVLQLMRIIRACKPNAVQTWLYHADLIGGVVAKACGVKRVFWGIRHDNLSAGVVKRSTAWVAKICAYLSWVLPTRIVSCSEKAVLSHVKLGYKESIFTVIPNGYNLEKLRPDVDARRRFRSELGCASTDFLVGMVARFDLQKDHENLIRALGQVKRAGKRFRCVLIGTGMDAENASLKEWIRSEGLEGLIALLGRRNDIVDVMNGLDVHVLSSLGEAFPNVLAEAMACGTPCVTTRVGDAGLIVGGCGWVVEPRTPADLADALVEARTLWEMNPMEWRDKQVASRKHVVNNFSVERMCESYSSLWEG